MTITLKPSSQSIVHRDLKSANVLLTVHDSQLKLADFGLAVVVSGPRSGKSVCGSRFWMAPEMLKNEGYACKADIWAMGCVITEMMDTTPPYYEHNSIKAMYYTATKGAAPIREPSRWSPEMQDFLSCVFQSNPDKRLSAEDLKKHCWITSFKDKDNTKMERKLQDILKSVAFAKAFDDTVLG